MAKSVRNTVKGTSKSDYLFGKEFEDDKIYGYRGHDQLYGFGGDDWLIGGDHNDKLYAGSGDDILDGGTGSDDLYGSRGTDTATYENAASAVTVDLDQGIGTRGEAAGDTYSSIENVTGSNFADIVYGNYLDNVLRGLDGNDKLYGGAGKDLLYGNDDNDELYGGSHHDRLYGDRGDDDLYGGNEADSLYGGDDRDDLYGGDGVDGLYGGTEADNLFGGGGNDRAYGGSGNDDLFGGDGDDTLYGGDGDDDLYGGAENDWLIGGAGVDAFYGGAGFDTVDYSYKTDGGIVLALDYSEPTPEGETFSSIEGFVGTQFTDTMHGGFTTKLVLSGGDGDDVMFAKGNSEETADELYGGLGNDEFRLLIDPYNMIGYHIDGGKDVDTLRMPVGTTFGYDIDLGKEDMHGGVEHLYRIATLTSIENVEATDHSERIDGNTAGNTIWAGGGSDTVFGWDGNDTLYGEDGYDHMHGDAGADTLYGGEEGDHLYGGTENDTLFGEAGNDELFGGDGEDTLHGGSDDDFLQGGNGYDEIFGGAGHNTLSYADNDTGIFLNRHNVDDVRNSDYVVEVYDFIGSSHDDEIIGWWNNNRIDGRDGNDTLSGSMGDDVLIGGRGNDTLDGGSDDDVIYGDYEDDYVSSGHTFDDVIFGDNGSDIIVGGAGADILTGGTVDGPDGEQDTFVFRSGDKKTSIGGTANDTITDFEVGIDKIDLSDTYVIDWDNLHEESWVIPQVTGNTMQQVGDDVVIYMDYDWSITLEDTQLSALNQSDFIFG